MVTFGVNTRNYTAENSLGVKGDSINARFICEVSNSRLARNRNKVFQKKKWREYFNLDIEKGQLVNLQIDQIVEITYNVFQKTIYATFQLKHYKYQPRLELF